MTKLGGVIGMAGHVDHGKTSLVHALTGVAGDRLAEEKARGITIDLGFARWESNGLSLGVIDVPGHERFVGTMVAGAAGIDAVVVVVAADDGVMPQTREHIAICEQLGIARGVIAITKIDAVDAELLAMVQNDVREATQRTFLEGAEIVLCSSRTRVGLDALERADASLFDARPRARATGRVWLPIDRAFTKHGHGTIATGTLARGTIATGDTLDLLVDDEVTKVVVRGLGMHGEEVVRASASARVAVNLRGIDRDRLGRGAVLTTSGWQTPTRAIDVALRAIGDGAIPWRATLTLHVGTTQRTVRASPLTLVDESGSCLARLTSTTAFATHAGDRFVLRRPELRAQRTIGGGGVVDPHPALARPKKRSAAFVRDSALDPRARVLAMASERAGGVTRGEIVARLPPEVDAAPILSRLVRDGELIEAADEGTPRWLATPQLERAKTAVRAALVEFHRAHPAAAGASVADLRGRVASPWRPLVPLATAALVRERLIAGGDRVAAIGHDARALADRVLETYRSAEVAPVDDEAARESCGLPERTFRDVVQDLVRDGRLERITTSVHAERSALDALVDRVRAWLDAHETLSPGDFKTLSGLTRKHAIPMLEWLDRHGVTRRRGDVRVRG